MIKKLFIILVVSAIAGFIAIGVFATLLNQHINQPLTLNEEQLIVIDKGASLHSLGNTLIEKNWIEDKFWLKVYGKFYGAELSPKAGTYSVAPQTTLKELLIHLHQGKEHQFFITFIEGTTFKEWLTVLSEHPNIKATLSNSEIKDIALALGIAQENPEGWFFPDTYAFTAGTSDIEILKRAQQKMNEQLEQLWQSRAEPLPYNSPYEALIMASIVEKESGQVSEKPIIASVFVNRLNKKMRLQTDPTVIYGLGERYDGDIKRSHLREQTAYNTYRINRLPPTPIAMPGLDALQAVMNPATTEYFYFVSQGNGSHVFSTNLKDHNRAVRQYQLGLVD